MITHKYDGPTFAKTKFWDDSMNRFIKSGTIINVRYVRVCKYETTVFFALPDDDIGHFAIFRSFSSDALSNIFNETFKILVN